MVTYEEEKAVIAVEHPAPHEFIHQFQTGAIEVVQSILSAIHIPELVIGDETTQGCWNILEMVKQTLPEPDILEKALELAAQVMPPSEEES